MATINDGIICPCEYSLQKRKVLFVLKEAVNRNPKDNDPNKLLAYLRDGADSKSPTWHNAVIWSYLIRHFGEQGINWQRAYEVTYNKKAELRKIAVININKEGGKSRTNDKYLYSNFESNLKNREVIRDQIEKEIRPDIVLCGGRVIRKCLKLLYPECKWTKVPYSGNNKIWGSFTKVNERIFIQFYHPQYTGYKSEDLFNALNEIMQAATQ